MSKINSIKENLLRAQDAYQSRDELWSARRKIEERLIHEQDEEEIRLLKSQKLEIDHRLDEIEDDDEARIEELRSELIAAIFIAHPNEESAYQLLKENRDRSRALVQKIEQALERSTLVANSIGIALASWERPLLIRVARFVFGQSPTEEITENLERAGERSSLALEAIATYRDHDPEDLRAQELCKEIEIFFNAFLSEREERWSFGKLKGTYHPSLKALEIYLEQLKVQLDIGKKQLSNRESEIENWIEALSKPTHI